LHPDHNERRPRRATEGDERDAGKRSLTILAAPDEDRTQAHCSICGHAIHAPRSVARGTGPVCAARVVDLDELEAVNTR
jgi:hypothetical protein